MIGFYGSPSEGKLGIVGNVAKKVAGQEPGTVRVGVEELAENQFIISTSTEEHRFNNREEALAKFEELQEQGKRPKTVIPRNAVQQHSIEVTPKLKAEVEKGQPLFQREGKAKPKGALETLENGKVIIHAMESPDFSTMVHEIIHIFEQDLTAEEISAVEEWSGKKQGTKAFSEAFARGGERYLREGKAPNEQLKAVFEKFKKWLTGIYKTLKGSPIEAKLSPEVKEIFDRLLAEQVTKPVTEQVTKPTETRKAELDQEISDILGRLGNIKSVAEENPFNNKDAFNEIVNLVRALAERGLIDIADGIDSIVKHLKGREDLKHFQRKHIDEIKDKLETELGTSPKASDKAPEGQRRRGVESNTFQAEDTPQQRTAKSIVDENPHYYQQMGFEMMKDKAHKLIDEGGGFESADVLLMLTTPGSTLDQDVTQSARALALHHFSTLMADKSVPEKVRANAFKSFLAVEDMFARVATKAGRGNAMIYMWKLLSPDGTLESVVRRTRQATEKKLGAKVKGTGKTRGELLEEATKDINEEVQGVIDGIIADGILDDILHIKIKNKQPKKRGKRVSSKEAIAKSKENLKALKDKYKSTKLTSSTVVPGLTQEAIEYAGGVAAEYAKIGYYKTADLIEKIRAYFSSEHKIKISDADIDKILSQKTENGKTIKQVSEEENKKAKIVEVVKDMESAIRDVVKGHWTKADEFGRDLKTKLMDEVGLTDAEAEIVAKPILEKVNEKVANTRSKAMEALIGKGRLPRAKREKKSITSKMIELINMGALTNEDLIAAFSKKFGLKQITKLEADTITRLATILQNASNQGIFEVLATKDLTKYIYELYPSSWWVEIADTWIALNYANMLFGFTTTILNSWSTGNNIMQKPFRDTVNLARWIRAAKRLKAGENPDIFNPFGEMAYGPMFQGMLYGVTSAKEVYKNGDFDDKYAELVTAQDKLRVPKLERNRFGRGKPYKPNFGFGPIKAFGRTFDLNIFNYAKYSNRNLIAQDKGMTETSYDMYLADAIRETLREETGLTGKALTKAVMAKITFKTFTPEVMEGLEAQLAEEVEQREKASKQEVSKEQKKIRMKELKREMLGLSEKEQAELDELARDNIFTGERYGFTGRLGRAVGRVINQNVGTAVLGKTWIPFTRVVANVTEFMLDHYPGPYGFMRANGWGITGMINRAANVIEPGREPSRTSQKGPVGSKAWYDQMGRASLGTASFILFASIGLGSDEDDWFQITGGYASEGYLKEGRKNVMPKYSIRIGHLDENKEKGISGRHLIIPYLNIPGLAIPLGLIGNANDRLNQGMDEESVMARMAVLFSLQNQWQTIAMVKDMNFVEGIERILTIVTDILKSDPESREAVMRKTGTAVAKNYINFLTRPSPHQNNAVRQIEKFFDPIQYSQKSIEEILAYSMSIQHFVNKPNVSIFGEDMKSYVGETLMPWPHWVGLRGNDDRWKFLAEYDAIPRRIFNQTFIIESDVIAGELEKRRLEPDELYVYSQTAGRKFNDLLGEYISSPYWYERGQTVEFYLKEDQVNGVKVDVNKLWAYAKEETRYDFGIRGGKIRSLDDIIDKPNFNYKTMEEILGLKK